ncbi:MAG: family 16 glycosylhydrolase, partial [Phycisphaerae bacterium]
IDTMARGNQKTPCQINNHVAVVKLNKGRNILAVKFVSGIKSSLLTMGGPNELRGLSAKLKVTSTDCLDNYDAPGERPGNPELIQDYPTPGLLAITGQGVYLANPEVSILFPGKTFTLPSALSGNFFATGLRIQSFGRHLRVDSSLSVDIAAAGGADGVFSLRFDHLGSSDTLTAFVQETIAGKTTAIRQVMLPYAMLPADVTVAVNQGSYIININSLSDGSFRSLSGESALLRRFGDKPVKTAAAFRSSTKEPAEIVVDNYFIGEAGSLIKTVRIPFKIERSETFDPVKAGWKMVFNDEFDGTAVDWDKWFEYHGKAYSKDFASLDGKGNLCIKTDYGPDGKTLMTSALWSKETFRYGYFESRFRFTKQPGWWAAFWLYGPSNSNPMLDGFEIDIFEDYYTRPKKENGPTEGILDHNLHVYTGSLLKSWNYNSKLTGGIDDFYTLGVKRTPFEISYYLNGKLIKSSANHSPYDSVTFDAFNHAFGDTPLYAILSGQIFGVSSDYAKNPKNGTFPEYFIVDYIRVYEYPEKKAPKVSWAHVPESEILPPGETIVLEAAAKPGKASGSKISRAYLFDNGCLIDYKENKPYRFEFAIDKKHYENTRYMAAGRQGIKPALDGYVHAFCMAVQDQNGMVGYSPVHTIIPASGGNKPYQGKAQSIPGTLKVGYYDEGGGDVAYYDTTPKNVASTSFRPGEGVDGDENSIGSIRSGEWMKYSVDIAKARKYDIAVPYGSPAYSARNRIRLLLDGRPIGELKLDKRTANWGGADAKAELKGVLLPAGRHTLTLLLIGAFNMANLEVTTAAGSRENKASNVEALPTGGKNAR